MIFDHANYINFLKSYIQSLGKNRRGELKRISEFLGISSTLTSQIIAGDRLLSIDHGIHLAEYLGLTDSQRDYFILLIEFERAGSQKSRSYFKERIKEAQKENSKVENRISYVKKLSEKNRAVFYSSWLYSAIHIFSSLKKGGVTHSEVASTFRIELSKAREIGEFLVETGICTAHKDKLKPGVQSTYLEKTSPHIISHHSNWRVKTIQIADFLTDEDLMVTAPVSISKSDFKKIRKKIVDLISDVSKTVKETDATEIACLNIDWVTIK